MNRFSSIVFGSIVIYMVLPIIIFLLGWVKPIFSIPFVIIIGLVAFRLIKDETVRPKLPEVKKRDIEVLVIAFIIIALWVFFSGIGGSCYQNEDHIYRNALFNMLVENDWPVVKTFQEDGVETSYLLVYYIAFWLPSAIVGKVLGISAGWFFQMLWASIGIWFFYYLISVYLKRISLLPLVILIFFSGLDVIGSAITNGSDVSLFAPDHLEQWAYKMQFSSFTTQLFWVFNQAIPSWLLTILILMQKKNKYIVFFMGINLLACPFPFIGLFPFLIYVICRNVRNLIEVKIILRDLFSIENILGGGISGIVTCLYFKANNSGQHMVFLPAQVSNINAFIFTVVIFILLEVGIYVIAVYKYQKKNPMLYLAFAFLCTCPLIQVGYGSDYCMRVCIPAQVVLFLIVISTLYKALEKKDMFTTIFLAIILVVGSVTPIHEFNRTIQETVYGYATGNQVSATALTDEELMMGINGSNFKGEADTSIFYKYLAR